MARTPEAAHRSNKEHPANQGNGNGAKKPLEEELKDDHFQGTGDSELDTTPPAKEGGTAGKNRKSHGAETDSDTENSTE
ncbi:MAG: hypothetical protein QM758_13900 [Armatimonas sp.]